jgi:hypothetical protein
LDAEAVMIGWWWVACATQEPVMRSTPSEPTAALASAGIETLPQPRLPAARSSGMA